MFECDESFRFFGFVDVNRLDGFTIVVLRYCDTLMRENRFEMIDKCWNFTAASRRIWGRVNDELRDDFNDGNVRFAGLSPYDSRDWLTNDLLVFNGLNWSCFFCNSSICALLNSQKISQFNSFFSNEYPRNNGPLKVLYWNLHKS